jgi:hypothetical protein
MRPCREEINMNESDFFQEIEHSPMHWQGFDVHVPLFYRDIEIMSMTLMAPMEALRAALPSSRLYPYRLTPWHGVVSITTYSYKDCDIGPYNEVGVSIPVTLDKPAPLFTGILRRPPAISKGFITQLPVTTEIARKMGFDLAGYPKYLAEIQFENEGDWLTCTWKNDGRLVMSMRGRKRSGQTVPRSLFHPMTYRDGYLLRSELVMSACEAGISTRGTDVSITLGDHSIADELRALKWGRTLSYAYCPTRQAILMPPSESYRA